MFILRWLMSVLLFVGRLIMSVIVEVFLFLVKCAVWIGSNIVKFVQWGALIVTIVLILLIPVAMIYGLFTDKGATLQGIIAFLSVGFIVFLIGIDHSPAGYGLSLATTTFFIHASLFDTFLKYSKGDVGLAWLILILASALVVWIIRISWWLFGLHKMGNLNFRYLYLTYRG